MNNRLTLDPYDRQNQTQVYCRLQAESRARSPQREGHTGYHQQSTRTTWHRLPGLTRSVTGKSSFQNRHQPRLKSLEKLPRPRPNLMWPYCMSKSVVFYAHGVFRQFLSVGKLHESYHCDGALVYRLVGSRVDHYFLVNDGPARPVRLWFRGMRYRSATDAITDRPLPMNQPVRLPGNSMRWLRFAH